MKYHRREIFILVLVLLFGFFNVSAETIDELDIEERAFLKKINNYRAQYNLAPLVASARLNHAASWMSDDTSKAAAYPKIHIDSLGRTVSERLRAFGYRTETTYSGENIAAGIDTATKAFTLWKNSPLHNAGMLNPHFKAVGIGRIYNPKSLTNYGWYWTTDFGGIIQ